MDGFLSSAVFIHPSIHLSHHIPTWDPAPPKSHHQICFVFASQQRISHRRRGEGGIHFWKNKPIFFPPRVESNAAEPLGPITVNKQPLPSVFWSAEGEPVRRAAAVFIGRRSHLEARPVGGVCPRFESVCRLLSLEQMENAQVGDSCRRRRRRRRCFLCCCFLCRCFLFPSLGPSSVCTELWDDVWEQRHVAQREETATLLCIDWQHPVCSVVRRFVRDPQRVLNK